MIAKRILTVTLLAFVGISLFAAISRMTGLQVGGERSPTSLMVANGDVADASIATTDPSAPQYVAIFFHAPHRCPTCRKIESYSHEALQSEINNGNLAWRVADYTSPDNATVVEQFKVMTSTVVLAEQRGNTFVRGTNLEGVWNHTDDKSDCTTFIRDAWTQFRKG